MRIDEIFRADRGPYSSDALSLARVEARLFDTAAAPRIGRFILSERVGRGGMGTVYSAFDPNLGRRVAVKVLHSEISGDRLLREARALAKLRHPNILTVYEVGDYQGQAYIATEYIDGHTLGELHRSERLPWRRWLALYVDAGRGLAAAHRARIIHRDFKPDNVLVDSDGRVVVADFGLATASDDPDGANDCEVPALADERRLTRPGAQPGTTRYMAPEQLAGAGADARSDQYSFCLALWEALHGDLPLKGYERGGLDPWRALWAERHPTPRWLRRVLLRGLHPSSGMRWPSMEMLVGALQRDRARRIRIALAVFLVCALAVLALCMPIVVGWAEQAEQEKADLEEVSRNEIAKAERRILNNRLVLAALREQDPTNAAIILGEVREPDRTPQWNSAATDVLLRRPISLALLRGHADELRGAAFSPDGQHVATASFDTTVRVWRTDGYGTELVLRGHRANVLMVEFSRDGRYLVSAARDGTARVWDLKHPGTSQVLEGHVGVVFYATFSPDGARIATAGDDGTVRLWTRDELGVYLAEVLRGHTADVYHVEFAPDGDRLVSASRDGTALLWDLGRPQRLPKSLRGRAAVLRAHFAPDGSTIVLAPESAPASLWRVSDGKHMRTLHGDRYGAGDAAFSPDSAQVITTGRDGVAKLWDARSGARLRDFHLGPQGTAVAFAPNGANIAVAVSDGTVRVWSTRDKLAPFELVGHKALVFALAFSPDGRRLLSSSLDWTARVWDVASLAASPVRSIATGSWSLEGGSVSHNRIALSSNGLDVRIYALATGQMTARRFVPRGRVRVPFLSPDERYLAAITYDHSVYLWDLTQDDRPRELTTDARTARFVGDDMVIVGHNDGAVSLHHGDVHLVAPAPAGAREVVGFSDLLSGRYVVSYARDGHLVRWDVMDGLRGHELATAKGPRVATGDACPDGLLATGDTRHKKVFLYDVPGGLAIGELDITSGVPGWLSLNCDRRQVIVISRNGALQTWNLDGTPAEDRSDVLGVPERAVFDKRRSLLLFADPRGSLHVLDAVSLGEVASLHDTRIGSGTLVLAGSLVVAQSGQSLVRISLDEVLRPAQDLQGELLRRTAACLGLGQWQRLYADAEWWRAPVAAVACEWRHGRSPLSPFLIQ